MKLESTPQPILLEHYRSPDYVVSEVDLHFELGEQLTRIRSKLQISRRSHDSAAKAPALFLNGENLKLEKIEINGRELSASEFQLTENSLVVLNPPENFELQTICTNQPAKNLACEGLYLSGPAANKIFCTQCEAESFRKITFYPDRPDVMAVFTVTIVADKQRYPALLSNGNLISMSELPGGQHQAVWHDPFKKPCYLFALVAGNLERIEDTYLTTSGRKVKLQIFARKGLETRCYHAMHSLKQAMKWDEDVFGLEYDLDIFMIVVAEDFNMGAMENKGLNVFNANYVLANPETATDADFDAVLAVVGHEYFHNWTGNRVTCRDWFQLSLKEGLTVYRDQRFSCDMGSAAVRRIEDVIRLRTYQFAEDASPMAHPVRPRSYISIDNFYTLTVYEKGAEVIRMIETIVGRSGFHKGMNLYFERHDGQAVTIEDFVSAMSDANNADLAQFRNWYDQSGTPTITVSEDYNPAAKEYKLTIEQIQDPKARASGYKPYHIPIMVGLLGPDGRDLELNISTPGSSFVMDSIVMAEEAGTNAITAVLHLRDMKKTFTFSGISSRPVLSLLRGFSAPVKAEYQYGPGELAFLIAHDADPFARWEAAQTLALETARELVHDFQNGQPLRDPKSIVEAYGTVIQSVNKDADMEFVSFMLNLPAESYIGQFYAQIDVDAIHAAREHMMFAIAKRYLPDLMAIYKRLAASGTEGRTAKMVGARALRSRVLEYLFLASANDPEMNKVIIQLAMSQLREAKNMTDELGALTALNRCFTTDRSVALRAFYDKWAHEPLVYNKWLMIQAIAERNDTLARVRELAKDPLFEKTNPNKIYSLYLAFSKYNTTGFHDKSGAAYELLADQILEIDARNPQVAARLMAAFSNWKSLDPLRMGLMKAQLQRILGHAGLSSNVFEIASKTLAVKPEGPSSTAAAN